jgi:hypothetical protein
MTLNWYDSQLKKIDMKIDNLLKQRVLVLEQREERRKHQYKQSKTWNRLKRLDRNATK